MEELKSRWKLLISEGKLNMLFDELKKTINPEFISYNEMILYSSQYITYESKDQKGTLEAFEMGKINAIREALLSYIDKLTKQDISIENSIRINSLFGSEWKVQDYIEWIERKLHLNKISFITFDKTDFNNNQEFKSHTRITSVNFGRRHYDFDTLFIRSLDYFFTFREIDIVENDNKLIDTHSPTFNTESNAIWVPLDAISKIKFSESEDDEYELTSPGNLYRLKIFTNGEHIYFENMLIGVVDLIYDDKNLCLSIIYALQFILDNRKSYPFDDQQGMPIMN